MCLILDIDECTNWSDLCHINATCINTVGSYDCECLSGFMGDGYDCLSKSFINAACLSATLTVTH